MTSQPATYTDVQLAQIAAQNTPVSSVAPTSPRQVSIGTKSTQVLAENTKRKGLSVVNDSANKIYVGLGAAAVVGADIALSSGGSWDGRIAGAIWIGEVTMIAAAGSSNNVCVVEV